MKHLKLLFVFLLIPFLGLAQQKTELNKWLIAGPQKLEMPLFYAIKNVDGEVFKTSDLLKSTVFKSNGIKPVANAEIKLAEKTMQWSEFQIPADSVIVRDIDSNQLIVLASYLSTDSWSNPKFKINTDAFCEIIIDGKTEKLKTTKGAGETSFNIKLNPGKHLILLKLISTGKQIKFNAKVEFDKEFAGTAMASLNPIRPTTIEDVLDGEKIASAQISPTGNYLIVSINEIITGTGKSRSYWILKDLKTNKDLMVFRNQKIGQLKWLPRTDRISYTVSADQMTDLYLFDIKNSKEVLIAEGIKDFSYYTWAPGEEFIVYSVNVEPAKTGDLKRIFGNDDRLPYFRNRSNLHILYLKSGYSAQLTSGNLSADLHDIHPDNSKILFSTNRRDYTEVPFSKQNLYELSLKTGKLDTIWSEKRYGGRAKYSPEGTKLLVEGAPECFGDAGKNVDAGKIANSYDSQLYIFDLKTKQVNPITLKFDPAINDAYWATTNDIYMNVVEKDFQNLYHYNISTAKFTKIPVKTEVLDRIEYAYFQPFAVYSGTSISTPQKLYFINLKTQQSTEIYFPEKERFNQVEFGSTKEWNFTNKNKTTIYGRVYYPPNFDKTKKYPVIVNYYGGTTPVSRNFGGRYPANVWAANGYIVYILQPSGATGFGQNFSALHVNGWGFDAIDDIIDGTKKFLESHPEADASNVGCIGASYGGFTTMLLQTRTDIFKTAISHAGISSITSYWGEGYWGYSYSAGATAYSYPWNRQDIYVKNSPVYNADKFNNSILLLHGTDDTNVPVGESLQFYAALKILGKNVEMVLIDGENHHILDYNKRMKWHFTIMSWFDKNLKNLPQQWNDLYPEKNL